MRQGDPAPHRRGATSWGRQPSALDTLVTYALLLHSGPESLGQSERRVLRGGARKRVPALIA